MSHDENSSDRDLLRRAVDTCVKGYALLIAAGEAELAETSADLAAGFSALMTGQGESDDGT